MGKKDIDRKTFVCRVSISIYALTAFLTVVKFLFIAKGTSIPSIGITLVIFILGLAIYLTPAETLLRFDRGTGYLLSKLGPFNDSGLGYANSFYTFFGIALMSMAILGNVGYIFIQ